MRIYSCSLKFLLIILLTTNLSTRLLSQKAIKLHKIEEEFIFDGIPNEVFWEFINPVPMVMHQPVFGNDPTEMSDIPICVLNIKRELSWMEIW